MTDPIPAAPTTPPVTSAPPKKNPWRVAGPIIAVLVVLAGGFYQFVWPAIQDSKFKVGACLDTIPTSTSSQTLNETPKVVDCNDATAVSKIIAVFDEKTLSDADTDCPSEWVAAISIEAGSFLSKDKLLCLVEA